MFSFQIEDTLSPSCLVHPGPDPDLAQNHAHARILDHAREAQKGIEVNHEVPHDQDLEVQLREGDLPLDPDLVQDPDHDRDHDQAHTIDRDGIREAVLEVSHPCQAVNDMLGIAMPRL